jgi:mitogen-activated protein kinase kinase
MSRIRSKRNFKSLQLDVSAQPLSPQEPDPVHTTRPPPTTKPAAGGAKKRPPPMNLKPKAPADPSAGDGALGDGILSITPGPPTAPASGTTSAGAKRMTYHTTLSNKLASLDMGAAVKYDLRDEDLKDLNELGQGNGGSVKKVEHVPTHTIMAKKVMSPLPPSCAPPCSGPRTCAHWGVWQIVLIDAKPSVRKQILRELQIMHDCHSEYIISFYGAFLSDPNICICMEFMDKGSLDGIYKRIGAIDIEVVAKVALAVLEGLTYLYDVHRIIHRGTSPWFRQGLLTGL